MESTKTMLQIILEKREAETGERITRDEISAIHEQERLLNVYDQSQWEEREPEWTDTVYIEGEPEFDDH